MLRVALLLVMFLALPAQAEDRRVMLTSFDRVRVDGPYEVDVTSGGSTGAVVSGDPRALDAVSLQVQGSTLIVGKGVNAWGGYPGERRVLPRIVLSTPAVRSVALNGGGRIALDRMRGLLVEINLSGSGMIDVAGIDADRVRAQLVGTGVLRLAGRVLRGQFQTDGAGTIDAGRLVVRALTVTAQSAGDSRFTAGDTAIVTATGSGTVRVDGSPSCTVRGPGAVDCGSTASR